MRTVSILVIVCMTAGISLGGGYTNIILKGRIGLADESTSGPIILDASSVGQTVTVEIWAQNSNGVAGVAGDIVPVGTQGVLSTAAQGATWIVSSFAVPLYAPDGSGTPTGQSVTVYNGSGSFAGVSLPVAGIGSSDGVYDDTWLGYTWLDNALVSAHAPVATVVTPTLIYATGFNIGGIPGSNGGMSFLGSSQGLPWSASFGAGPDGLMVASYALTVLKPGNLTLTWIDSGKTEAMAYGGYYTNGIAVGDDDICSATNLAFTTSVPQAVAAPTFDPTGGTFSGSVDVTISCTTPGATIRFTTDGSAPSHTNGTVYAQPVHLTQDTTLKAFACEDGMIDSPPASAAYTITPPSISDITDNVSLSYSNLRYDRRTGRMSATLTLTNTSNQAIGAPLTAVIVGIDPPEVTFVDGDGTTPGGNIYADFTPLLQDNRLDPGQHVTRQIICRNPWRYRFTVSCQIWGTALVSAANTGTAASLAFGGLAGDIDSDGSVNLADLKMLVANWGRQAGDPGADTRADVDSNGSVDLSDLKTLVANFGNASPVPGDISGDNAVSLADFKSLLTAWNSTVAGSNWSVKADLDDSGNVNLHDLKILITNWKQSGD